MTNRGRAVIETFAFTSIAAVALISALLVVAVRNTVHSALFLGLCLSAVGGLFAALGADFLFAGQILVYVGGIAVLIMFVVMLLGRESDLHLKQVNQQAAAAVVICLIALTGLLRIARLYAGHGAQGLPETAGTTRALARLMLGDYAVPFEAVSLVLTAALLGVIVFSRPAPRREEEGS